MRQASDEGDSPDQHDPASFSCAAMVFSTCSALGRVRSGKAKIDCLTWPCGHAAMRPAGALSSSRAGLSARLRLAQSPSRFALPYSPGKSYRLGLEFLRVRAFLVFQLPTSIPPYTHTISQLYAVRETCAGSLTIIDWRERFLKAPRANYLVNVTTAVR